MHCFLVKYSKCQTPPEWHKIMLLPFLMAFAELSCCIQHKRKKITIRPFFSITSVPVSSEKCFLFTWFFPILLGLYIILFSAMTPEYFPLCCFFHSLIPRAMNPYIYFFGPSFKLQWTLLEEWIWVWLHAFIAMLWYLDSFPISWSCFHNFQMF